MQSKNYHHTQISKNYDPSCDHTHHLGKFIPNLLQLCYALRPVLKKNTDAKTNETDAIEKLSSPSNLKKLRSFM